jgi:hypothetical protein
MSPGEHLHLGKTLRTLLMPSETSTDVVKAGAQYLASSEESTPSTAHRTLATSSTTGELLHPGTAHQMLSASAGDILHRATAHRLGFKLSRHGYVGPEFWECVCRHRVSMGDTLTYLHNNCIFQSMSSDFSVFQYLSLTLHMYQLLNCGFLYCVTLNTCASLLPFSVRSYHFRRRSIKNPSPKLIHAYITNHDTTG